MLSDFERHRIDNLLSHFCDHRVLAHVPTQVRLAYTICGNSVTLFELRPTFNDASVCTKSAVAQFRLDEGSDLWSLYWRDRTQQWHRHESYEPTRNVELLLVEVDRDRGHIFWD